MYSWAAALLHGAVTFTLIPVLTGELARPCSWDETLSGDPPPDNLALVISLSSWLACCLGSGAPLIGQGMEGTGPALAHRMQQPTPGMVRTLSYIARYTEAQAQHCHARRRP